MIEVIVTPEGINQVIRQLNATPAQIIRAKKRATTKTLTGIKSDAIRALAREHDMPTKAFKKNNSGFFSGRVVKKKSSVWLGLNPVKSGYIGRNKAAPNHGGAFARNYFFQDGFLVRMQSGHQGIFKRKNAKRNPISEQTVELVHADSIAGRVSHQRGQFFMDTFKRELNYEVNRGR